MSRVNLDITLGILLVLLTGAFVLAYGLREEERMAEYSAWEEARAIEAGAELFDSQCSRCHGTQGLGIQGLCPPLNDRNFFDNRLAEVSWSGTLEDYIVSTVSSGRLASTRPQLYPGNGVPAMPSFHENFGGPLREEQIRNIAAFIMNWEQTAQVVEVNVPAVDAVGADITVELPAGDAANGEALATSIGCAACHILAPTGPAWAASADLPGIGERGELRISDPAYTGNAESAEQYLLESIIQPGVYLVSGYQDLMPHTYSTSLGKQDVADLIAYLLTIK
jgi:mono/diheme cytochrome c family protein